MEFQHKSVLLQECIDALNIRPDGIYLDGTLGGAGHSSQIARRLTEGGRLIGVDRDRTALAAAKERLAPYADRVTLVHSNFAEIDAILDSLGIPAVDGMLFDLGVSSPQLDDASRGFSYMADAPLDMRMDTTVGVTAAQWLASAPENEIARVIHTLGEERFAKKIAKAIVQSREETPLTSTQQLAKLVAQVAIRIHINSELDELSLALEASMDLVEDGGRIAVITFHSLEDRIVKRFFDEKAHPEKSVDSRLPLRTSELPAPQLIEVKRILPTAQECASNPRARSAILRVATRTRSGRPA